MGRPPLGGGPAFRFTQNEVVEMESCLHEVNYSIPSREIMCALAEKFSASADRMGRITVQPKQIWNWFQNRRYAQRAKSVKPPAKLNVSPMSRDDLVPFRNVASNSASTGKHSLDSAQVEFEAKSARDGAWYDVAVFLSHRMFETGDPEVRVRFAGFGVEEDEWINVRKCVRQRSLPCEAGECVVVLPGDLILCFQEGSEQALYFDARVLDAQRRRHDVRGCRCRFLVRYEHNQTEEIVPLRKVCRRPESDHRLQMLTSSKTSESADQRPPPKETISSMECTLTAFNTDDSTAAVPIPSSSTTAAVAAATASSMENVQQSAPDFPIPSSSSTAAVAAAATATSMEIVQQSAPDIVVEDTAATPLTAEKPSSSDMS